MKRRDILLLLGSSVFLVIVWIIFSIIHQLVSTTINETISQSIEPIQPTFNISVINALKTRQKIAPAFTIQEASQSAASLGSSSTTPTPTPSIVPTLSLSPTPIATQGGKTQ